VLIGDRQFVVSADATFTFGRVERDDIVGLDPSDMGISAVAGSIRHQWGLWWLENLSRKRRLLLGDGSGGALRGLECRRRTAIDSRHLTVLVPGAIHTHRVEVALPASGRVHVGRQLLSSTGSRGFRFDERDKDVLVALLSDYLDAFPSRPPILRSYREAAELLGPPWTKDSVRKRLTRLRQRASRTEPGFAGPLANLDLADHLVANSLLVPADRDRLGKSA
jgi:hypothetical protein